MSPLIAFAKSSAVLFSLPAIVFHTSKADLPSAPVAPVSPFSPLIALAKSSAVLFSLPAIDFHTSRADFPSAPAAPVSPLSPFSPLIALAKSSAVLFSFPAIDFHTSRADLPSAPFSPGSPFGPLKAASFFSASLSNLTMVLPSLLSVVSPSENEYNSLKILVILFFVTTSLPPAVSLPLSFAKVIGFVSPMDTLVKLGDFNIPIRTVPASE